MTGPPVLMEAPVKMWRMAITVPVFLAMEVQHARWTWRNVGSPGVANKACVS